MRRLPFLQALKRKITHAYRPNRCGYFNHLCRLEDLNRFPEPFACPT